MRNGSPRFHIKINLPLPVILFVKQVGKLGLYLFIIVIPRARP